MQSFWFRSFSAARKLLPEREQVWNDIANTFGQLQQPTLRTSQNQYEISDRKDKGKVRDELNASGLRLEQTEIDKLSTKIVEKKVAQEAKKQNVNNENQRYR